MASWATRIEIASKKQVKTPCLMNPSFNDQEKQAEPVTFSCWEFDHLLKMRPKFGGLIPKLALCLLIGGHAGFAFLSQVFIFPHTWNINISVQHSANISVNSTTEVNWVSVYKSFVSVFHLPYHLCFERIFLLANRTATPCKEWTQDYENKIDIKVSFHFFFPEERCTFPSKRPSFIFFPFPTMTKEYHEHLAVPQGNDTKTERAHKEKRCRLQSSLCIYNYCNEILNHQIFAPSFPFMRSTYNQYKTNLYNPCLFNKHLTEQFQIAKKNDTKSMCFVLVLPKMMLALMILFYKNIC